MGLNIYSIVFVDMKDRKGGDFVDGFSDQYFIDVPPV